ncbi:MAG: hypothetical protein KQH53_15435 [Desulfarculaceae bacterium]|nr:hypothetical protein [Desulfarculaceae bacterium]
MKILKLSFLIAVSLLTSLVGTYLFGQTPITKADTIHYPEKIVAHSIFLVDENNRPRAGISFDKDKNPAIFLKDTQGKTRAYLACTPSGPILGMNDSKGNIVLALEASNDGSSSFGLTSNGTKPRLMMAYSPNQGPTIGLFDENNVGKAVISVTHGNPSVTLLDQDKKPAIAMLNRKGEGSILGIWNSNNEPAVSLAVKGDKPGLFMYQQPRTGLLFNTAGGRPALALMNNGTPIWSATGDTPPALDMPLSDDLLNELTR